MARCHGEYQGPARADGRGLKDRALAFRPCHGVCSEGVVSKIEPSHFDPATAYVAVDFHLMDNRDPWLYKTTDFGKTWTKITGDLPTGHPLSYARVIAENPNKKGMLFAGTGQEHALLIRI